MALCVGTTKICLEEKTLSTEPYLGKNAVGVPISNSEIQTFKDCKRKWWLSYYRGLQPKAKTLVGPLPLGTRVHKALEVYYRDGNDPIEAYRSLLEADTDIFYESKDSTYQDVEKKFLDEGELGRLMVEGYVEWLHETSADVEYSIVDVEQKMEYPVRNGRAVLVGKTDLRLIDRTDESIYIGDFKTAVSFNVYDGTTHMSEQLMMYTLLAHLTQDTHVAGGVYIVLKKVKRSARAVPPFFKRYVIRFNQKTLESFTTRLLAEVDDILSIRDRLDGGEDHKSVVYPSPSSECTWKCPFYSACPMFDDGSDVEGYLSSQYEVMNPYERYGTTELDSADRV